MKKTTVQPSKKVCASYQMELIKLNSLMLGDARNLSLWFMIAQLHAQYDKHELAIQWLIDILNTKPKISDKNIVFIYQVYRRLAKLYLEINQPEMTITYLKKVITLINQYSEYLNDCYISLSETHIELGMLMSNMNKLDEALDYFSTALNYLGERPLSDPAFTEYKKLKINAYEFRAITYRRLSKNEKALDDNMRLINEYEEDEQSSHKISSNYFKVGRLHQLLNNEPKTFEYFNKALNTSLEKGIKLEVEALSEIYRFFTSYYFNAGEYICCIDYAKNVLKIEANVTHRAIMLHMLSKCCVAIGLFPENMEFSQYAVQLTEPEKDKNPLIFAESCLLMANALYFDNQWDIALEQCRLALVYFQTALKNPEVIGPSAIKLNVALTHRLKADILLEKFNPQKTDFTQALKSYKIVLAEESLQTGDMT